jgi:hypothetical protein
MSALPPKEVQQKSAIEGQLIDHLVGPRKRTFAHAIRMSVITALGKVRSKMKQK